MYVLPLAIWGIYVAKSPNKTTGTASTNQPICKFVNRLYINGIQAATINGSIIAKIKNNPQEYPKLTELKDGNGLKITKKSFENALINSERETFTGIKTSYNNETDITTIYMNKGDYDFVYSRRPNNKIHVYSLIVK